METKTPVNPRETETAYTTVIKRGLPDNTQIIFSDAIKREFTSPKVIRIERGDQALDGLAIGGALGGIFVGIIGALVGLDSPLYIPFLGLFLAGPLATGLVGTGLGCIFGGLLGVLIGLFFNETHATIFTKKYNTEGHIMMGANTVADTKDDELVEDWKKYKDKDIT